MKTLLTLLLFTALSCAHQPTSNISTQEVSYKENSKNFVGFVAKPKTIDGKLPAILVVHEWWGQTDYPRERAKQLAEMGYVAMAVDMYGDRQTADHPKDAGAFAKKVMSDAKTVRGRFDAALKTLKAMPEVDGNKIAAIGYCFGGGVVLEMARQGVDLKGVVSFHGSLSTPSKAKRKKTKASVLVLNGADDSFIPKKDIDSLKKEMKRAKVDFEFVNYPGAIHGFTNPEATEKGKKAGIPLAYNEEADKKSWEKATEFFQKIFK